MTLIIGMVGNDGIVAASDRRWLECRGNDEPENAMPAFSDEDRLDQWVSNPKYYQSDSGLITCFCAGGKCSQEIAAKIVVYCERLDHSKRAAWETTLMQFAHSVPQPYTIPVDHLIVVRKDSPERFWVIRRRYNPVPNEDGTRSSVAEAMAVDTHFCVGGAAVAQFLPRHLHLNRGHKRSIAELKTLALLTLSYAAEEQPTNIAPPFDVMTLDKNGKINWSVHEPMHRRFQQGIERLLDEENTSG